jgi:hypothetical protein
MLLKEKLESIQDEEKRREFVRRLVDEGTESEFGEWVRLALDEFEESVVAVLKRLTEKNEIVWNAVGRLQAVEMLKAAIFPNFEQLEEMEQDAGTE